MRRALALPLILLAAAALALAASSLHGAAAPRHTHLLASARTCSAASGCAQGCAEPVASRAPAPLPETSPCGARSSRGCTENVARRALPPSESSCEGAPADREHGLSPGVLRRLDRRARETLRKLRAKRGR
jgi:hypothetical protein